MAEPAGGHVALGWQPWGVALLLPAAVVLAVLSALLERSGPIRLSHWAEEAGGRLRELYDHPARFGAYRMLLSVLARVTPIAFFYGLARLLDALGIGRPTAWAFVLALLVVAATEVTIRVVVMRDPERALAALTGLYHAALVPLAPLAVVLAPLMPAPAPGRGDDDEEDEASDEEIEAFIDVGTREGILEPEEGEWVSNIVLFGDTQVRSVMTPRIDMVCAPVTSSLDGLAELFIDSGHSRIPLFENSIDHIVGILHIRDLLRALRGAQPVPVAELIKPPLFVPETKPLAELLKEFQQRFQQIAIVVDEYGGTSGLVTVEDLLEEIVGEIADEHDEAAETPEQVGDGVWRLDGRAHIDVLDDLFGVEIDEPGYETVAGLIFSALGHVPHEGETVERKGLRFTVEAVEDRRIKTVRVERALASAEAEAAGAEGRQE